MDVREDSSLSDSHLSEELVEFFVVSDRELKVSWDNSGPLVILGGVTGELEKLSGKVLEDSGEVDWSSSAESLGESAFTEIPSNPPYGELETGLGRSGGVTGLGSLGHLGAFSDHLEFICVLSLELELRTWSLRFELEN